MWQKSQHSAIRRVTCAESTYIVCVAVTKIAEFVMIAHSLCVVPAHWAMVTQINYAIVGDRVYSDRVEDEWKLILLTLSFPTRRIDIFLNIKSLIHHRVDVLCFGEASGLWYWTCLTDWLKNMFHRGNQCFPTWRRYPLPRFKNTHNISTTQRKTNSGCISIFSNIVDVNNS